MSTKGSTASIALPHSRIRHHQFQAGDVSIHVAETGPADAPAFLLVHGWPESWRTWQDLMLLAGRPGRSESTTASRLLAIDLPGIGASTRGTTGGFKAGIAGVLRQLVEALRPRISHVESAVVDGSGHFPQEEATARTWSLIRAFAAEAAAEPVRKRAGNQP